MTRGQKSIAEQSRLPRARTGGKRTSKDPLEVFNQGREQREAMVK
jgi:hypothetical protein